LQSEPLFRAVAAQLAERQRHLVRHRPAFGQDGMKSLPRDPRKMGDLGARAAEPCGGGAMNDGRGWRISCSS
jgi:hypothetical protein